MKCSHVGYVKYVPEVTQHPDYDKAIETLRNVAIKLTKGCPSC